MKHQEILVQLKKIPALYKEFTVLENEITGAKTEKKTMSKEAYYEKFLKFVKAEKGNDLKSRIERTGTQLYNARPDFTTAYQSKEELERYIKAVGRIGVSTRIKEQLELLELLEIKRQFQNINDFLDETKIKALNTYLKGRVA
jgi:hypothetical protein